MLGSSFVVFLDRRLVDLDALSLDNSADLDFLLGHATSSKSREIITHPCLEPGQISRAEGISLCNDRDQVDSGAESLHDLNVQRL